MPKRDENEVRINNKELLEQIRAKGASNDGSKQLGSGTSESGAVLSEPTASSNPQPRTSIGDGHATSGTSVNGEDSYSDLRHAKRVRRGTEEPTGTNGSPDRFREGVRQTQRQAKYTDPSATAGNSGSQGPVNARFQLRNPFNVGEKEPPKLFTKAEAELEIDRMTEIYFHGSGILDDILEIVVKDHEEVQIWQLEQTEAQMLAKMHLARAQVDKGAAISARKLLGLYDRLILWMLAVPRVKATVSHIGEHGGLSFK